MLCPVLEGALGRPARWKGGRPPVGVILKFQNAGAAIAARTIAGARFLMSRLDGATFLMIKDALWDRFVMGAPRS